MSTNKYIPLPGGKECKLVNPYEFGTKDYSQFENINTPIAITEVMPEGETFEGRLRYQISEKNWKTDKFSKWKFTDMQAYDNHRSDTFYRKRIVVTPLKAIEPVKERIVCGLPKSDAIELVSGYNPAINIPKYASPNVVENKQETVEDGITQNFGKNNGIMPCPYCNEPEGENVVLGYNYPHFMITCIPCSITMKHDRKDKVIGFWNNRLSTTDHAQTKQSKLVELIEAEINAAKDLYHPLHTIETLESILTKLKQ